MVWVIALKPYTYDLYEMLSGYVVGFLGTIVVSLMTQPPVGAAEEMTAIRREIADSR